MTKAEFIRPEWPAPANVSALVTVRNLPGKSLPPFDAFNVGAQCGDNVDAVLANRALLGSLAALPGPPHWLSQVHGVAVHRVTAREPSDVPPQADAAITEVPGAVLAILTADCLPVLFASRDGSEIGAAHAGWRGLAAGVLEASVAAMRTSTDQLLAWLGPAAGPARYEIGEEVRAAFVDADPGAAVCFVVTRPGHFLIDLYALARRRLAAACVTAVSGGGLCTLSDPARFYSYRRDGRTGRMATLLWMREQSGT
ncbi:peptidoglycan editing factor PgeF [Xanthomonadaceae bacterium JHOS43]|nr:peptidoglycan editing factor PgeF [Xanthomonadaceae bacterium JHOS43]MCX7564424.1 peptidoglycan editing factor PgeF [Xanthomonadaceae bacterium XH05]